MITTRVYRENADMQAQIIAELASLNFIYPDFNDWLRNKVFAQLDTDERKVFVIQQNSKILGILILKDTLAEKKICTLRVSPQYSKQGIGSKLMDLALRELHTARPVITVSEEHNADFQHILKKYGFMLYSSYANYYRQNAIEYSYNGAIEPNEKFLHQVS